MNQNKTKTNYYMLGSLFFLLLCINIVFQSISITIISSILVIIINIIHITKAHLFLFLLLLFTFIPLLATLIFNLTRIISSITIASAYLKTKLALSSTHGRNISLRKRGMNSHFLLLFRRGKNCAVLIATVIVPQPEKGRGKGKELWKGARGQGEGIG